MFLRCGACKYEYDTENYCKGTKEFIERHITHALFSNDEDLKLYICPLCGTVKIDLKDVK